MTLVGLAISVVGLALMSTISPGQDLAVPVAGTALFGLGFGLTVTPRSTAAVEAAGRALYGMASASVTVARMVGMAVGMAILTAFGTSRIDAVSVALSDQAYRDSVLPPELAGRPLADALVLDALEHWAATEASAVLGALFLVAALVTVAAAWPAWLMGEAREAVGAEVATPVEAAGTVEVEAAIESPSGGVGAPF
jgi:hypothetical protein